MTQVVIKPVVTFHENKNPEPALLEELFRKHMRIALYVFSKTE